MFAAVSRMPGPCRSLSVGWVQVVVLPTREAGLLRAGLGRAAPGCPQTLPQPGPGPADPLTLTPRLGESEPGTEVRTDGLFRKLVLSFLLPPASSLPTRGKVHPLEMQLKPAQFGEKASESPLWPRRATQAHVAREPS